MLTKIKRFFYIEIDDKYKAGFAKELKKANNLRSLIVLYAIGGVMILWLIPAIYLNKNVTADSLFLLVAVVCIIVLNLLKNRKRVGYFHLIIMSICLLWAQYSNFTTNGGTDNFTPYLVGVLAFATIPYVKPLQSAIILGINQIIFLFVNSRLIEDHAIYIDLFGNSTLFLIFAWAIAVFHYNAFVNSYINTGLVEELNKANKKLEEYMRIDIGTGINNRLAFEEALKMEWERSKRNSTTIALMMIDIDYFKQYNDTYGHSKGDACLRDVAQCIDKTMARASDFAGRYGGEEFAVIIPEAEATSAQINAERVRSAVEKLKIKHESRPDGYPYVTISLGVATMYPGKVKNSNALIERADKALYDAKRAGRNRIKPAV